MREIDSYEKSDQKIKGLFLEVSKVRKIHINHDAGIDINQRIIMSSCTCPDFIIMRICQHLLAVLVKKDYFKPNIELKAVKKRERPKKVSAALEVDLDENCIENWIERYNIFLGIVFNKIYKIDLSI